MVVEALITKEMLQWARLRSSMSVDVAAKRLGVNRDKWDAWEQGKSRPTFRQAQELAKKLRIPFGYLYLSKVPDEVVPLPDLRIKLGAPPKKPSPDFLDVLYDAMRKQEWYHEYLSNEQADPVAFVGHYSPSSPVGTVAEDIRRALRLDDAMRRQTRDKEEFFVRLVERAEGAGVLVMRSSIVGNNTRRLLDPEEFQGFAMTDSLAPLVFVNQNDYLSAQIFTLIHELAHIWMGVSGISGQDYLERPAAQANVSQRRADEVAAETLVPATEFTLRWNTYTDIDQGLRELQRHYRVSIFVILRRAYDLGNISFPAYRSKYDELREEIQAKKKGGGGGGYSPLFSRNSKTVTTTLLYSVLEGRTLPTQASELLNIRPITLYNLERYLVSKKAANA